MNTDPPELTERQQKFCEIVAMGTMSIAKAWMASGHECKNLVVAQKAASRARALPHIKAYLADLNAERRENCILTKEEMERYLSRAILTPAGEVDESSELCESYEDADGKVKVKMPSKIRAAEILAKLRGYFAPEQISVQGMDEMLKLMTDIRGASAQSSRP